jgi:hypothetical protein
VDVLSIAAGDNNIGNVDIASAIPAGTNLIGKVGIDQTTPGTTNRVDIGAAIPAGTNNIGDVDILSIAAGDTNIGNVDVVTMPAIAMPAVASSIKLSPTGGSKTVSTTGTGEALVAAPTKRTMLYVRAKTTNTGNVYLGDGAVDKTASKQIILTAGQAVTISAPGGYYIDINEFYVDVDVNAEGVDFLYV